MARTASGIGAGSAALSPGAAFLLALIDGRRTLSAVRALSRSIPTSEFDAAIAALLDAGHIQLLGQTSLQPPDQPADDARLLLSLDFTRAGAGERLRQAIARAGRAAAAQAAATRTGSDAAADTSSPGGPARPSGGQGLRLSAKPDHSMEPQPVPHDTDDRSRKPARDERAQVEADLRAQLVRALRPRVEEALRMKLTTALRPIVERDIRARMATVLRPVIEAELRAKLEKELRPRIELELRTRYVQKLAESTAAASATGRAPTPVATATPMPFALSDVSSRAFNALPEPLFCTDRHGEIVKVNAAWAGFTGYGDTDSVGRRIAGFFDRDDTRGIEDFILRIGSGRALHHEYAAILVRVDGARIPVELRASPLLFPDGTPDGICGTVWDASRMRATAEQAEAAELRLLLLLDQSREAVVVEDAVGTLVQVNEAFCRMFGVGSAPFSFEGAAIGELISETENIVADVSDLLARMARIRSAARDLDREEISLQDGATAFISYRAVTSDSGEVRGHIWVFRAGNDETD